MFHKSIIGTTAALLLLTSVSHQGMAANLSVTDGTVVTVTGETYTTKSSSDSDAALYSSNKGSTINGTNLTVSSGAYESNYSVLANNGGTINLTDSNLSGYTVVGADGDGSSVVINGGTITALRGQEVLVKSVYASNKGSITLNNVTHTGEGQVMAVGAGSLVTINGGTYTVVGSQTNFGVIANDGGRVVADGLKIISSQSGVYAGSAEADRSTLAISNFEIEANGIGIYVEKNATASIINGSIHTINNGAIGLIVNGQVDDTTALTSATGDNIKIVTEGDNAIGFQVARADATFTNVDVTTKNAYGLASTRESTFKVVGANITVGGEYAAVYAGGIARDFTQGGSMILDQANVTTTSAKGTAFAAIYGGTITASNVISTIKGDNSYGITVGAGSTVSVSNSQFNFSGKDSIGVAVNSSGNVVLNNVAFSGTNALANGLLFNSDDGVGTGIGMINLTNSSVSAVVAVNAVDGQNTVGLKGSVVGGTSKLFNAASVVQTDGTIIGSTLTINADNSSLSGGATTDSTSTSNVNLSNGSVWTISSPTEVDADGNSVTKDSNVSSLSISDSTLSFAASSDGAYQTLTTKALNLSNASITMNTLLNEGGSLSNQQTDRLLVNGDVTGTAVISIVSSPNSTGAWTSIDTPLSSEGISIIQVAGNANEKSFSLKGGYVTLGGLPYQYGLYAYGPTSTNGTASDAQRLVSGTDPYWDYRLQSVYKTPDVPTTREVAPQVSNYIVAPEALFQADQQDIANLHDRLGEIRKGNTTALTGAGVNGQQGEFFMRAYGGTYDYSSNVSGNNYGYDAKSIYAAMQAGGNLYGMDTANGTMRFGVSGSYGELNFTPKNVAGSQKTTLNKWTAAAYATYQHDNGFYVDGIVSYGGFQGHVTNTSRGATSRLKGDTFSVSAEVGKSFELGHAGLAIEPQAQITYQRLMFDNQYDIDNFVVRLGNLDQWTGRIGGRLTKTIQTTDHDRVVTVYSKLNLIAGFGDGGTVNFGDNFQLGKYGSAVEGGLGVSAQINKKVSLYGDVAYQNKIEKAGFSGATFNGGFRVRF